MTTTTTTTTTTTAAAVARLKESSKPFPLSATLRDLALFRASDVDLASILPEVVSPRDRQDVLADVESSLERSYEFVREAKAVMNIHNKGLVETQGLKVEQVRGEMEDVLSGLEAHRPS